MPRQLAWAGAAMAALALVASARPLAAQQSSLTIYNDGRVLVRRSMAVAVPKGESVQQLKPGAIDIGSLLSLDSTIKILQANYDSVVGEATILRRSIGKRFNFQTQGYPPVQFTATLVGMDPERWRTEDGTILFQRPGLLRLPDELAGLEPRLELWIQSAAARPSLGLSYFTHGAWWRASYQVVLGRGDARVQGVAVITAQAVRADSAEIQLLAGSIRSPGGQMRLDEMVVPQAAGVRVGFATKAPPSEERVEESHVYTLPGRWSLAPGTATLIPLFDATPAPVVREYVVRREPIYGLFQEAQDAEDVPVEITYTLTRRAKTPFGDRPLPAGVARVFRADGQARLQLVGEAALAHTAAGKDLVLRAGSAFDLTARRRQTDFRTERDSSAAGVRTRAEAAYDVALTNATDSAVTIEVREERAGEWSVVSSSVPAEKVSATVTRFRVAVPARGQTTLTYRIRAIW